MNVTIKKEKLSTKWQFHKRNLKVKFLFFTLGILILKAPFISTKERQM